MSRFKLSEGMRKMIVGGVGMPKLPKPVANKELAGSRQLDQDSVQMLDAKKVYEIYISTGSVHKAAQVFNVSGDTIHQLLRREGMKLNRSRWTSAEIESIKSAYTSDKPFSITSLSSEIGRTHAAIACKAESLGLTSRRGTHKRTESTLENMSSEGRLRWTRLQHPRGMSGKKHTQETKDLISKKTKGRIIPPEQSMRSLKTRVMRYGKAAPAGGRGSWKSGWRTIGGQRIFARSRWEANYARYLEFLIHQGHVLKWEHEPETFWFEKIKRGVRSYLPDFRVTLSSGLTEFHEVKGWMDPRSKTKIKRMAKYHPSIKLRVIDGKSMSALNRQVGRIIKDWES